MLALKFDGLDAPRAFDAVEHSCRAVAALNEELHVVLLRFVGEQGSEDVSETHGRRIHE